MKPGFTVHFGEESDPEPLEGLKPENQEGLMPEPRQGIKKPLHLDLYDSAIPLPTCKDSIIIKSRRRTSTLLRVQIAQGSRIGVLSKGNTSPNPQLQNSEP